ncbi:hypothetical protein BU23DRAFT_286332 [Bimuria novae-zelandiae CBS 107.79]|uniref:Zn(2)-C6 fungal-type domain-containing protein n=1 Tax=Bimuria novae-zelandiae CBS 107.79 TaxID=1447943 RepID=A0A6A5USN7_9PLEO|nr:hypothetical protein BU23DRAFT_286332 [Bimuria novae-zelandiae CBS 107.79]
MESNLDNIDLYAFDQPFDPNRQSFNYNLSHQTWPLPPAQMPQQHDGSQQQQQQQQQRRLNTIATTGAHNPNGLPSTTTSAIAPHQLQTTGLAFPSAMATNPILPDWINLTASNGFAQQAFAQDISSMGVTGFTTFGGPLETSPVEFPINTSQALMTSMSMPTASNMMAFTSLDMTQHMAPFGMADFAQDFSNISNGQDFTASSVASASAGSGSPTEQWLEVRSLSSSDNGWNTVDFGHAHRNSYDYPSDPQVLISNPAQTLQIRRNSDSSAEGPRSAYSLSSFEEIQYPLMHSPQSEAENQHDLTHSPHSHTHSSSCHHGLPSVDQEYHNYISPNISPNQSVSPPMPRAEPVDIKHSVSSSSSPTSSAVSSPPTRRKKSPVTTPVGSKPAKTIKKSPPAHSTKKDTQGEKRVGRRRGPLRPEQRQQAHEIRKLRACLRCKFLKKTCDKGDPCGGCQPSHARLWQVPCTRIDIKDIAYFMKDWKADYERHVSLGFSIGNIKGFSPHERPIYITHGYGHYLPIMAREVYVRDEKCFGVDWFESLNGLHFEINTAKLSAGMEGVSRSMLSDYLDRHIDGGFEPFVDEYFEGTYFVTEILKTAYRFYCREKLPVIRKALKLVVAYNLTLHVTMVEGLGEEEHPIGKVEDNQSKFHGKTVAPVMINFQVKCALADMWRELQKDVLEELSSLYSSVYSGDKLKNWPTIFMLAAIILALWELIQFDCNYRVPDQPAVQKFCNDMESTPVGVIVGLFSAISQKLPAFSEWDTQKHHHLLNSNPAVCDAMTEVRAHVTKYDSYLRTRSECKFDRNDFDSLSNKFLSKLVIRAN